MLLALAACLILFLSLSSSHLTLIQPYSCSTCNVCVSVCGHRFPIANTTSSHVANCQPPCRYYNNKNNKYEPANRRLAQRLLIISFRNATTRMSVCFSHFWFRLIAPSLLNNTTLCFSHYLRFTRWLISHRDEMCPIATHH